VVYEVIHNPRICISQLARDLGDLRRPTVSKMVNRVRAAMNDRYQRSLLRDIVNHFEEGKVPKLPLGGDI
jgi:hypothetical protein